MPKRRHKRSGRRFIQLFSNVKRSTAYHDLSCNARGALIELIDRYNGCNNGAITLGVRELAYELGCSISTAHAALRELDDAGLVQPMKVGSWRGKRASQYRLTFLRCDVTGELPCTHWEQRPPYSEFAQANAQVRQAEHREPLRSTGRTHRRNSSMNGSSLSSPSRTHIDLHHQGSGKGTRLGRGKARVSELH